MGGRKKLTQDEFIERANEMHGNQYDYSLVEYKAMHKRIKVVCPDHGPWEVEPTKHIHSASGCPKCGIGKAANSRRNTLCDFIARSTEIHGAKYDYSLVDYQRLDIKVKIVCPNHGEFEQLPGHHVAGSGCPSCHESKGEKEVARWLDEKNIRYEREKRFDSCRDRGPLPFDFFLPDYGVLIEYDGEQHNEPSAYLSKWNWAEIFYHDLLKNRWARENGYMLIRIKHDQNVREVLDSRYVEGD